MREPLLLGTGGHELQLLPALANGHRLIAGATGIEAAAKSAARAMGSEMGRPILRGVLGSILGGSRRRR